MENKTGVDLFCEQYNINKDQLSSEAISMLNDKRIYLPELCAGIHIKFGDTAVPSAEQLSEYITSDDNKFHFGFDVDGWKKIPMDQYLKSIGRPAISSYAELNSTIKFFEENKNKNLFAHFIIGCVYLKEDSNSNDPVESECKDVYLKQK